MSLYKEYITEVPDFPIKGVSFKDISPLLASNHMFRLALMDMLQGHNNDLWAGVDSRGFLFAAGLAGVNGGGVLMIRKKDKLPPPVDDKYVCIAVHSTGGQLKYWNYPNGWEIVVRHLRHKGYKVML